MHAWLVTSPEPMSSSKARRTISFITRYSQSVVDLVPLSFVLRQLLAQGFDHVRWRLAEETLITQLALDVGDILDELRTLFFVALALRVFLEFGQFQHQVELRRGTHGGSLRRGFGLE